VPISYPPGAFFATSWIRDISTVLPFQNASLLMFYFWTTLAALVPSATFLFNKNSALRLLGLLSVPLLFLSVGFIAAVDRANNLTFAIPFIVIFIYGVARNSILLVTIGMIFGLNLRPQFIVFAIVLIGLRRYKHMMVSIGISCLVFILSFFTWPNVSGKVMFGDWLRNSSAYSSYSLPSQVDDNLSLTHGLHTAMTWFGTDAPWSFSSQTFALLDSSGSTIWIVLIPVITLLHFFIGQRLSLTELVFNAVALVILIPGTTFLYYLVWFSVIPVAVAIDIKRGKFPLNSLAFGATKGRNIFSLVSKFLTYSTMFLLFVPFPFTKGLVTSCDGCSDASLSMTILPLFLFMQIFLNLYSAYKLRLRDESPANNKGLH
jgi:hypothetical protein